MATRLCIVFCLLPDLPSTLLFVSLSWYSQERRARVSYPMYLSHQTVLLEGSEVCPSFSLLVVCPFCLKISLLPSLLFSPFAACQTFSWSWATVLLHKCFSASSKLTSFLPSVALYLPPSGLTSTCSEELLHCHISVPLPVLSWHPFFPQ